MFKCISVAYGSFKKGRNTLQFRHFPLKYSPLPEASIPAIVCTFIMFQFGFVFANLKNPARKTCVIS